MSTPSPTMVTPPAAFAGGWSSSSHRQGAGRERCQGSVRLVSLQTERLRDMTRKVDRLVSCPHMPNGHIGRAEQAIGKALECLELELKTLEKWDRVRGYTARGGDSSEFKDIEDGGNG